MATATTITPTPTAIPTRTTITRATTITTDRGGQWLVALDLEGVLVPEIWVAVAEATGVDALRLTTREVADYDELMANRLAALDSNRIPFSRLEEIVAGLEPFAGAVEFLRSLQADRPVAIVSDTYEQLARPLLAKLGHPLTLCHRLRVDADRIVDASTRRPAAKRAAVEGFRALGYRVAAAGDSFNDVEMLDGADRAVLFRPAEATRTLRPRLPVARTYVELDAALRGLAAEEAEQK
ncbi:MAG: bifunctional phosphoserine phosphatase/homoserine phosphotransferase ThrH [Actinomycetota bacterium]